MVSLSFATDVLQDLKDPAARDVKKTFTATPLDFMARTESARIASAMVTSTSSNQETAILSLESVSNVSTILRAIIVNSAKMASTEIRRLK